MARFRKKPIEVEAVQYVHEMGFEPRVTLLNLFKGSKCAMRIGADCLVIETVVNGELEGVTRAVSGDWLIKGVNGEVYPCKPDVFEKTYEPV